MRSSTFRLYRLLERAGWLRSYVGKFFFVAFLGTHLPLIGLLIFAQTARNQLDHTQVLLIALTATLAGTSLVLWTLHHLLAPILLAEHALDAYLQRGEILDVPSDLSDEAGRLLRNVGATVRQFDATKRALELLAQVDELTGLLNRRGGQERLATDAATPGAEDQPLCVAFLDIDHFKSINDSYGHDAGDAVLVTLGLHLSTFLSASAPVGSWAARWGGEEFLVALPTEAQEASALLEQVIATLPSHSSPSVRFTVSAGIAERLPGEDTASLLQRADAALYSAKQQGRARLILAEQQR